MGVRARHHRLKIGIHHPDTEARILEKALAVRMDEEERRRAGRFEDFESWQRQPMPGRQGR